MNLLASSPSYNMVFSFLSLPLPYPFPLFPSFPPFLFPFFYICSFKYSLLLHTKYICYILWVFWFLTLFEQYELLFRSVFVYSYSFIRALDGDIVASLGRSGIRGSSFSFRTFFPVSLHLLSVYLECWTIYFLSWFFLGAFPSTVLCWFLISSLYTLSLYRYLCK